MNGFICQRGRYRRSRHLKSVLSVADLPKSYYSVVHDLPDMPPPPLDPKTRQPVSPDALLRLFAKECIAQEMSTQEFIRIPEEVREAYLRLGRPTALH